MSKLKSQTANAAKVKGAASVSEKKTATTPTVEIEKTPVDKAIVMKETAPVKKEEAKKEEVMVKTVPASKKSAKASAKKEAPKKSTTPKKTEAKKTEAKAEPVSSVYIEFAGKQIVAEDVLKAARKSYESMNKSETIKTIEIYIKPEENAAYYVVNGKGSDEFKVIL